MWNWNPDNPVMMDLETQSLLSLPQVGSRAYLRHSSTRLLSAAFERDGQVVIWVPMGRGPFGLDKVREFQPEGWPVTSQTVYHTAGVPDVVQEWINDGATFVAHNAETFDAEAWRLLVGGPQPSWYDTIHCCRAGGYPAGLDAIGRVLTGRGKDAGKAALKLLYTAKADSRGRVVYPVGTIQLWSSMLRYNVADVLLLREVYEATKDFGEPDVLQVNAAVNDRGFMVDLKFALALKEAWVASQIEAKAAVEARTNGELQGSDLSSIPKMKAWLARNGLVIKSLERQQLEALINDPDSFFGDTDDPRVALVTAVLRDRQQATRATAGKVDRVLVTVDADSRIRGQFKYHGAGTGRWSGREMQPHNMARQAKGLDMEATLAAYEATGRIDTRDGAYLASLFRPMVVARPGHLLCAVDYSGVEARGVRWIAKEPKGLAVFADVKQDIYCAMASQLCGRTITKADKLERQAGKQIVLGCGYGMGVTKFGARCRLEGFDLSAAGLTAEQCVKAFRDGCPEVPETWKAFNRAMMSCVQGGLPRAAGRCAFRMEKGALVLTLPSTREIWYRCARVIQKAPKWDPQGRPVPTLVHQSGHGFEKDIYGGLMMENVVQALCRDFMADAMVKLKRFPIVLHVHDEIVVEEHEDEAESTINYMANLMSRPPWWAEDFPLRVEGFTGRRYTKEPLSGAIKVDYMNGKSC